VQVPFWEITLAMTSDISTSYLDAGWTDTSVLHVCLDRPELPA
jgi:hypothetical protein